MHYLGNKSFHIHHYAEIACLSMQSFFVSLQQLNWKLFFFAATPAEVDGGCCNNTQRGTAQ